MILGAGLLALSAAPAWAAPEAAAKNSEAPAMPDFDIGKVIAIFDKIFPPQPEPPAARLALSRTAVQSLFPDGSYGRMMSGIMHGVVERAMGLSEADLGKSPDKGKPAGTTTLRQKMQKDDPAFEQRMSIAERVIQDEFAKMTTIIEPRLRDGLAHSMARRFDEKQLADINAFLATDSGRAFGSQSMAMWVDPEVMRSMITAMPEMMTEMPAAMQRIEAETAHLPKPRKDKVKDARPKD